MIKVGIIINERCQASSVFAATDLLMAANFALGRYFDTADPLFTYQLMGLNKKACAYNGIQIDSIIELQECERPDIVILPGAFESILSPRHTKALLDKMSDLLPVLRTWHEAGTVIASVCTGNFILASANISGGRPLTCHWASEETAKELFPDECFDSKKLLVDHGDIVSAGGAMAMSQMILYLVSRFHSRELALATGKLMMVELNLNLQSRFLIFKPQKDHQDLLVSTLQNHIETRFNNEPDINSFASDNGISLRQLTRRFKAVTGETPLTYLQRFRVEKVKIGLESSNRAVCNLIWDVGYDDPTSFRRLFKRLTGLTMHEYRNRFSSKAS